MSQDPSSSFLDSPPSSNAQSHKFLLDESFDGLGDDSADAFSLPQRDRDQASKSSAHPEKKNAGKKRMSMATSDLRRDVQGQQRESRATGGDSRIGNLAAKLSKAKIDNPPPSSSSSFNSNEPSGSSSQSQLDDNFEDDDQMRRGNRRHTDDDSQQAVDGEEGERGDMPSDRSEALLQERDQLAMMNTMLEACVDGLRGASEKVQVRHSHNGDNHPSLQGPRFMLRYGTAISSSDSKIPSRRHIPSWICIPDSYHSPNTSNT